MCKYFRFSVSFIVLRNERKLKTVVKTDSKY